jgi:ferredoxin
VAICPKIFKFGDDNKSYAYAQPENDADLDCAKQAEAACPVRVIHVEEKNISANNIDYNPDEKKVA